MSNVWRDIRFGIRTALKSPGYSAIAIGTLALAIGANTLLFSIVSPLVLQSLPVKDPQTLGWVFAENDPSGIKRGSISIPDFLEWRAAAKSFSDLGARETRGVTILDDRGDAERVQAVRVTSNICDIWGLHPALGRTFLPGEDEPGKPMVVILSHHYWKGRFNSDPKVLGTTVSIDGHPATIVGVMDAALEAYGYAKSHLWLPLTLDPAAPRDQRSLRVVGRLAAGASLASAQAELVALSAAQARDHANTNANWRANVVSTRAAITNPDTWVIIGLLGVVVLFVLLIACANLANLVLARVLRRRHEFAVRLALGASRLQLVRPLLAESLVLSIIGAGAGLAIAQGGLRLINATAYDALLQQVAINTNVLVFTGALALVTPFLFSLWPALGAGRGGTAETLRDARSSGGRPARRRRQVLVAAEVALAMSLLIVSGLVLRTMINLERIDTGLDVARVLTFRLEPASERYATAESRGKLARDIVAAMRQVPGATGAAVTSHLPVLDTEIIRTLDGTSRDRDGADSKPFASYFAVTPEFFHVAGIELVAGRAPAASDTAASQPVAVINRMAAEKYFDSIAQALGRTVTISGGSVSRAVTVVGVVANTRDSNVTETKPQIYAVFDQSPPPAVTVLVQSAWPADRSADVRAAMRKLDPALAVSTPKTLATLVAENNGDTGIVNGLFTGFAVLALLLAAAGLYGVISHSVGQRQREIGVRLALGAAPASIRRMVVIESLRVTGAGMIAGLLIAGVLAYASASVFYGIEPLDPATFGGVILLVFIVSLAAVWSPASRAMRVDPARTLRAD